MKWLSKLISKEKAKWSEAVKEVEEQTRKENEAWDKWRALPENHPDKYKTIKPSHGDSDGRFWPFGTGSEGFGEP